MDKTVSKILRIRGIGGSGLNTDAAPWELPETFITSGQNFRVLNGAINSFGSQSNIGLTLPSGFAAEHLHFLNGSVDYWLAAGEDAIYIYDGASWDDVTGETISVATRAKEWQSSQLGRIPILNNPAEHPLVQVSPPGDFSFLQWDAADTWATKGYSCKSIRPFRSFLLAMNMYEGGVEQPDVVRWSHPADSGGLPVSWDEGDPNYRAGKQVLGGEGGDIMDGMALRDAFCVYRERGIALLDFTGGPFVFNIRSLTDTANLINTNSISEAKGVHIFISEGDVVMNDGNQISSLMHGRVRSGFSADFNEEARSSAFTVHHRELKEIWCCIPVQNEETAIRAWVYNYRDDTWSVRDMPEIVSADYGPIIDQGQRTWDNWTETWQTASGWWNQGKSTPFDNMVIGVDNSDPAQMLSLDAGGSADYVTAIERISQPLETIHDVVSVQSVYPLIDGVASCEIQIGMQNHAGDSIKWKPWRTFMPGVDRKIDMRLTGELISWRIRSSGTFKLTGLDLQYVDAGFR